MWKLFSTDTAGGPGPFSTSYPALRILYPLAVGAGITIMKLPLPLSVGPSMFQTCGRLTQETHTGDRASERRRQDTDRVSAIPPDSSAASGHTRDPHIVRQPWGLSWPRRLALWAKHRTVGDRIFFFFLDKVSQGPTRQQEGKGRSCVRPTYVAASSPAGSSEHHRRQRQATRGARKRGTSSSSPCANFGSVVGASGAGGRGSRRSTRPAHITRGVSCF